MKTIYQSKTFWLNLLAMLSLMIPAVQTWLKGNPEAAVAALTAANILVRFVTSGKITLFPDEGGTPGNNSDGKMLGLIGVTAAGLCMGLPSCNFPENNPELWNALRAVPITIGVTSDDGEVHYSSKGGLVVSGRVPTKVDRRSSK